MIVDTIGEIADYEDIEQGALFFCNLGGQTTIAMKIAYARTVGAISFSHAVNPSARPPLVLDRSALGNRSVMALKGASFQTPTSPTGWKEGRPYLDQAGVVILGSGSSVLIRAYERNGFLDVDIATGVAEAARNHPENIWTEDWRIVLKAGEKSETVIAPPARDLI
jgi:hypothetical protein